MLSKLAKVAAEEFEQDAYGDVTETISITDELQQLRAELDALYAASSSRMHPAAERSFKNFCALLTIKTPEGLGPMLLWDWQQELYELIEEHDQVLLVKSRQQACSTLALAYALYKSLRGTETIIVTHFSGGEAFKLARRFRAMLLSLGDNEEYKAPELITDNLSQMIFADTKSIVVFGGPQNAGRGIDMASLLLYDEAAFFGRGVLADAIAASGPSSLMSQSAKTLVISTPNGMQANDYWDLLGTNNGARNVLDYIEQVRTGAIASFSHFVDTTGWVKAFINWDANPYLKAKFKDTAELLKWAVEKMKLPLNRAKRELTLDFSDSASSFLASEVVLDAAIEQWCASALGPHSGTSKEPFDPVDGATYILCGDTAGEGRDWNCFFILERLPDGKVRPIDYYRTRRGNMDRALKNLYRLLDRYPVTRLSIEKNVYGALYLQSITANYPDIENGSFSTSKSNRSVLLDLVASEIETLTLTYPAGFISEELMALEETDSGKVQAASGFHDDAVFALAHGLYLLRHIPPEVREPPPEPIPDYNPYQYIKVAST